MTESILLKEIQEQPDVVRKLISLENNQVEKIIKSVKGSFEYILIAARGSSDNAARYAQYLFGTHNQLPVALATPSLFTIYRQPPHLNGALVIGISQSGQSPDIVQVISEARKQNRPTISITNDVNSPLARASDHLVKMHAGVENATAASKTYMASLTALALLSAHFIGGSEYLSQIQQLPEKISDTIANINNQVEKVNRYRYMEHCAVIGRGLKLCYCI